MDHTLQRHRRLYKLLSATGNTECRHDLIRTFTDGRTGCSNDLSDLEIEELIHCLERMAGERQPGRVTNSGIDYDGQAQRRRILSCCYSIGWTRFDHIKRKHVVDFEKLNGWMLTRGYLKKPMNDYTRTELQLLVKQFERMTAQVLLRAQ